MRAPRSLMNRPFLRKFDDIFSKPLPGGRLALLAAVITLHGLLFWILSGLIIFRAPSDVIETATFQAIAIPAKPVQSPPPIPVANGGESAGLPTLPISPAPAPNITTVPVNFTFTVPKVTMPFDNDGKALAALPAGGTQSASGNGTGQGTGQGVGQGAGDLLGGTCGAEDRIAIVLDVSLSMKTFDRDVVNYIRTTYKNARIYDSPSAKGTTLMPFRLETSNIRWTPSSNDVPLTAIDRLIPDLYGNVYEAMKDEPEVIVIISDFEDGYSPEATAGLVATFRRTHTKLVLLSREMAAYPGLPEYAHESGGSYGLITTDSDTVTSIVPDPKLTLCPINGIPIPPISNLK